MTHDNKDSELQRILQDLAIHYDDCAMFTCGCCCTCESGKEIQSAFLSIKELYGKLK